MRRRLEVFADITCPFTHVGLKRVVAQLHELGAEVGLVVRAWPLEWVNGEMFTADAIATKIGVLHDQLGVGDFAGFDRSTWPSTSIPALNLCAAASRVGPWTLRVLKAIERHPNLAAIRLAEMLGYEKAWLKLNIRKLKNLGLTISHQPGYELSPRGSAVARAMRN